jgi:tetratricopeptide (TPR) repeat protein
MTPPGLLLFALSLAPAPDPAASAAEAKHVFDTYAMRTPRENAQAIEKIVEAGDFPERAKDLVWLGTQYLALDDVDASERWFERAHSDYPTDLWGHRALLGLGQVASRRHHFLQSEKLFREAADALPDERADALRRAAVSRVEFYRMLACVAGWLVALAFIVRGILAVVRRRSGWSAPFEVKLLGPLAAAFFALSFANQSDVRLCMGIMAAGMFALIYVNALYLKVRPRWPALHLLQVLVAGAGVAYGAVYASGLLEPAIATLSMGLDR